jgi:hypothetical protein
MVKVLLYACLEIILGAVILYFNLKAFLLYCLIIYFYNSHRRNVVVETHVRMNTVLSSVWTSAIMRKLNITDEELEESVSRVRASCDRNDWNLFMQDIEDLTGQKLFETV